MPIANASLLDEATAAAEAMTMLHRVNRKSKSNRFLVDRAALPQTIDVVENRAATSASRWWWATPPRLLATASSSACCCSTRAPTARCPTSRHHRPGARSGALVAVAADLMSLVLLTPPGEMGADAARLGPALWRADGLRRPARGLLRHARRLQALHAGPHHRRLQDSKGRTALRMALQTREQHIRRDKATSNICTAQALLAVISGMYGVWHGRERLKKIARRIHRLAGVLAHGLAQLGFESRADSWFDTLTYELDSADADAIYRRAQEAGINLRRIRPGANGKGGLGISVNEKTGRQHVEALLQAFAGSARPPRSRPSTPNWASDWSAIPAALRARAISCNTPCFTAITPKPTCCAT
jgi:glycine dehydrogenase